MTATNENISLVLKDVDKCKKQLKDVKKEMKTLEKIEDTDYLALQKKIKELREEIKARKEAHEKDLLNDSVYNSLRELKMKKEEEIANHKQKLNSLIAQMPVQQMQLKFESDEGIVNVMMYPQMKLFLNGKEEKI